MAAATTNNTSTLVEDSAGVGLHNPTTVGYDSAFFTPDLQYNVEIGWFGACTTSGPSTGCNPGDRDVPGVGTDTEPNGAFASTMTFSVYVPVNADGLLAGQYSDGVTFTLAPSV